MKRKISLISLIIISTFFSSYNVIAAPTSKVTALIIDEDNVPIQGAKITVGYMMPNKNEIGIRDKIITGSSNIEGYFSSSSDSFMPQVTIRAEKEGFYRSSKIIKFTSRSRLLNRWQPWNPTIDVVLKKIRNPVPMFHKYLEAEPVPSKEKPIGYDLESGDWVVPYGKGQINDLIVTCQNTYEDFKNAETSCDISFSNPQDGFQIFKFNSEDQSYYKWPFEAPSSGYDIKKLNKWMSVHMPEIGYKSNYKENTNYLFRVRTGTDKNGNIVKAKYGKIAGDIRVYKKAEINFSYYFNPDGTRNLEEDPDKNLFKK